MATSIEPLPAMADEATSIPDPSDPPSFGKNNRDLPEQLKSALSNLVEHFQKRDLYNRRVEALMDRKLRFYDDGVQHFYANYGTGVYQIGSSGASVDIGTGSQQCSEFMGAYNIARARRRTIDSVLTQNPPGIVFEPDRPDRSEDIEASETAEGYRHLFDQKNDISEIQQIATRFFELSGRCVARVFTDANRQKWGLNDQGQPRQMETVALYGTLESKVPIVCKNQDKSVYCFLFDDLDILQAKRDNSWLKENGSWKIAAGESSIGESDWERFARLGVKQVTKGFYLTGTALENLITEMHAYLRPDAFEHECCEAVYTPEVDSEVEFEQPEDGQLTLKDVFNQLYPEGVCITYLGKAYSESCAESMDDTIKIIMPEVRDGQSGGALMEPMAIIQDSFNDGKNAEREFYEKGWPVTWFKGDAQDYDAFVSQQSKPAQFALLKNTTMPPDVPVENFFYREPEMAAPETFVDWMKDMEGELSQDITGAVAAIQGTAKASQTASGQAMDRSQAMGMLGPCWARVQTLFAFIYKAAALLASKNPDHAKEIVVVTGDKQTAQIHLEKLTRGSFHCKPDKDSSFPESTAAQRATLNALLPVAAASPVGVELFASPDNWEEIMRIQGMPDLVLTPALAYRKQTRELEILIREAPVPNQQAVDAYNVQHAQQTIQAMQAGLPGPPFAPPPPELPSVMPKKFDYHDWEFKKCQEYLSSEDCFRQQTEGNADGIRNVELHAELHQQMMAALAPPPVAPMPAPKGNPQAPETHPKVQQGSQPPGAPGQPTT